MHATLDFDFPDFIARVDIPAGIPVHEYNATADALGKALAGEELPVASLEGRSNCKGSGLCGSTSGGACTSASSVRYREINTDEDGCHEKLLLSSIFVVLGTSFLEG